MKLLKVYEAVLAFFKLAVTDEGQVIQPFLAKREAKPFLLEDKTVWLPTQENLKAHTGDDEVFFHPLKEFVDRGQSPMVARLRHNLNIQLNLTIFEVMASLADIILSPKVHDEFTPEQRQMLLTVKNWSGSTKAHLVQFATGLFEDHTEDLFLNIFLRKAGTYRGEKHARVGIVTFDWYRHIQNGVSKNDLSAFKTLLEFMFPESHEGSEEYNDYSDSIYAPWLECLMKTAYKVTSRINEIIDLYEAWLDPEDVQRWRYNHDWLPAFDNLDALKTELRLMPALKGNEGTTEQATATQPARQTTQQPAPVASRAVPAPRETVQEIESTAYEAPKLPPPPPSYPPAYPPPNYPVDPRTGYPIDPRYAQHPAYQPPPPQRMPNTLAEDGKLNFDAMLATNPAVGAAALAVRTQSPWGPQGAPPGYQVDPRIAPGGYPPPVDPRIAPGGYPPPDPRMMYDQWGRPMYDPRIAPGGYPPGYQADPRLAPGGYPAGPGGNIYPV